MPSEKMDILESKEHGMDDKKNAKMDVFPYSK
jgi:hypothetical protein